MVYHLSRTNLPKGLGQEPQNRYFPLSPPPNHTSFISYLWPMTPPRPILAGYRLVVPGLCACFPFRYVQKSIYCSCVCHDLEARRPCFLTSYVGFSLFLAMLYCYSCCNNLILLGLFWAIRLFLLSVACHGHCFAFTYGLLCPFGHPRPVCFLWASLAHLLIPLSHGLFTNFIGLPWPNNLILILGVHGPTINPLLF